MHRCADSLDNFPFCFLWHFPSENKPERTSAACREVFFTFNWTTKMVQRNNKTPSEQRNFAFCFRPIYYFARVCGQMPFTITSHTNAAIVEAKVHKRDIIWFAISMFIQISFIWMAIKFYRSYQQEKEFTSTIYFGNLTIWFISLLCGICVMTLHQINRLKIVRILNKITVFDTEVRKGNWHRTDNCIFFSLLFSCLFVFRQIQMIRFGVYFDYKMGNRHAWLYCGAILLFASFILAISFHTYQYFLETYTVYNVIEYVGTGLHQNQMMGAPLITYIYLLRNLQKRYAVLNQLLRFSICISKSVIF